jgi:hypothetical protein
LLNTEWRPLLRVEVPASRCPAAGWWALN